MLLFLPFEVYCNVLFCYSFSFVSCHYNICFLFREKLKRIKNGLLFCEFIVILGSEGKFCDSHL